MTHDPLADLGILTQRHNAEARLRWTRHGYTMALECAAGRIASMPLDTVEGAAISLLGLVAHYTRPDGGVEWAPWPAERLAADLGASVAVNDYRRDTRNG